MSFVSFAFPLFFSFTLILYYGFRYFANGKFQWTILLCASYLFYGWVNPIFLLFIILSTVITYLCTLKSKKWCIVLAIILHLGLLGFLKYANFVIDTIDFFGAGISHIDSLILPLGISFYTFQSIGYLIDVYRGTCGVERNIFKYALFVSYFPHISQGPIGRFEYVAPQLFESHALEKINFEKGLYRILLGYFEKLVVAGRLAPYVTEVFNSPSSYSGLALALAVFFYSIYLYADFSGYMNIALGCSQCFGVKLDENFDTPYFSTSIAEYWRRWHITLGTWFKDYLYYPLLRSPLLMKINKSLFRKGHKAAAKNVTVTCALTVVWFMTGLWHGAAWHYIAWGMWHGFFIITSTILCKQYASMRKTLHIPEKSRFWHIFRILRTYCIVLFGYVFFASHSIADSIYIIRKIFTDFHLNSASIGQALLPFIPSNIAVSYALIAFLYIVIYFLYDVLKNKQFSLICSFLWNVFMVASIILFGYFGSSNFVYIQF